MRIQHPLEVVVVDYLEFEAKMEMTKTRDMQDDDGQVDVRWIPEIITAKTPVNIGIGPTDKLGRI